MSMSCRGTKEYDFVVSPWHAPDRDTRKRWTCAATDNGEKIKNKTGNQDEKSEILPAHYNHNNKAENRILTTGIFSSYYNT